MLKIIYLFLLSRFIFSNPIHPWKYSIHINDTVLKNNLKILARVDLHVKDTISDILVHVPSNTEFERIRFYQAPALFRNSPDYISQTIDNVNHVNNTLNLELMSPIGKLETRQGAYLSFLYVISCDGAWTNRTIGLSNFIPIVDGSADVEFSMNIVSTFLKFEISGNNIKSQNAYNEYDGKLNLNKNNYYLRFRT